MCYLSENVDNINNIDFLKIREMEISPFFNETHNKVFWYIQYDVYLVSSHYKDLKSIDQ